VREASWRRWALASLSVFVLWAAGVWCPADHWAAAVPSATVRALHLFDQGQFQDALQELDAAPARRQPGLDTLLVRGFADLGAGNRRAAEESFRSALRIEGQDPDAWLGFCLHDPLQTVQGHDPCARAVALGHLEPGCAPLLARAIQNLEQDRALEAREDLEECRAIDPMQHGLSRIEPLVRSAEGTRTEAKDRRGLDEQLDAIQALLAQGRFQKALKDLERLEADQPSGIRGTLLRSDGLRQVGRTNDAVAIFEEVAPRVAESTQLLVDGCLLAVDLDQLPLAESLCTRVDTGFPVRSQVRTLRALGLALLAHGRLAKAEDALAAGLALAPSDASMWADAARVAAARGEVDLSLSRLRRALELDPDSIDVDSLRRDVDFASWRADPRTVAALDAIAAGELP
jgi:tetratricopeptide (TPR) repeat protein